MNHHMVGICSQCGGVCDDRAERCHRCYEGRGGDPAKLGHGWAAARRLYPVGGPCENGCGAPSVEHHHLDGDPLNNARENVLCVCRRCHMQLDGRLRRAGHHRHVWGEAHGQAKLTEAAVTEMRRRRAEGALLRELAAEFGVGQSAVSAAVRGKTWTKRTSSSGQT